MRFTSRGIGWLIAGGIICATAISSDSLSDVLITLIIAGGCFFAFYRRNKSQVDAFASDMGMDVYRPEPAAEPVEPAEETAESEVEFDIETK